MENKNVLNVVFHYLRARSADGCRRAFPWLVDSTVPGVTTLVSEGNVMTAKDMLSSEQAITVVRDKLHASGNVSKDRDAWNTRLTAQAILVALQSLLKEAT